MKKQSRFEAQPKKKKKNRKLGIALRIICVLLCSMLLSAVCVGCTTYASTDELLALKTDLNNALNSLDFANDQYAAALQELDLLKGSKEEINKALEELKTEYENTKGQLQSMITSNKEAEQEIASLKGSNEATEQELNSLKNSYQSAQEEIDTLKGTVEEIRGEINTLKDDNEKAQREIDRLKDKIKDLNNKLFPEEAEKIRIYIDQGHNPTPFHNAGATGNGLYEQDLTFTIGVLLAELLEKDGRFVICLSRPTANTVLGTDNDTSLDARVEGAEDFEADYFISLHINSHTDSNATGIEVYTAEQNNESYSFGNSLLKGMVDSTNLRDRGMKLNPDFRVLKNATMPAALLEMGFISNSQDAALLSEHPELFAEGIYNGILSYFDLLPNEVPLG